MAPKTKSLLISKRQEVEESVDQLAGLLMIALAPIWPRQKQVSALAVEMLWRNKIKLKAHTIIRGFRILFIYCNNIQQKNS